MDFLQNHPGSKIFPVPLKHTHIRNRSLSFQLALGLWVVTAIALLGVQVNTLLVFFDKPLQADASQMLLELLTHDWPIWGTAVAMLLIAEGVLRHEAAMPLKEQRKYYMLTGQGWLDETKRHALQLDAVRCYNNGLWCETLEPQPMRELLPSPVIFRHLKPIHAVSYRKRLEGQWEIFDSESYAVLINQCLRGHFSEHFLYMLTTENNQSARESLSTLMQISPDYLEQCLQMGPDGRPPKLVWGFDLYLIIQISRESYVAGYIDEETAWSNIQQAATLIFEVFESYTAFYLNFRLGHAFWSQDVHQAQKLKIWYENYLRDCDWPIRQLMWPLRPQADLSYDMQSGFRQHDWDAVLDDA